MSQDIEHCYTCKNVEDYIPTICVPVHKNNLGTLENYSRDIWNCTLYSPSINSVEETNNVFFKDVCKSQPFFQSFCDFSNDKHICYVSKLLEDFCSGRAHLKEQICDVDEALYDMCNRTDHNGICLTASIIHYYCVNDYEGLKTELCKVEDYAYDMCVNRNQNAFCSIVFSVRGLCTTDKNHNYFPTTTLDVPVSQCFTEKIRCLVSQKCRELIHNIFKCRNENECLLRNVNDTDFLRLLNCMFAQY